MFWIVFLIFLKIEQKRRLLRAGPQTEFEKKRRLLLASEKPSIRKTTTTKNKIIVWLKDLAILGCKFEFYVKNCVYSRLEMSGDPKFDQKISKIRFHFCF